MEKRLVDFISFEDKLKGLKVELQKKNVSGLCASMKDILFRQGRIFKDEVKDKAIERFNNRGAGELYYDEKDFLDENDKDFNEINEDLNFPANYLFDKEFKKFYFENPNSFPKDYEGFYLPKIDEGKFFEKNIVMQPVFSIDKVCTTVKGDSKKAKKPVIKKCIIVPEVRILAKKFGEFSTNHFLSRPILAGEDITYFYKLVELLHEDDSMVDVNYIKDFVLPNLEKLDKEYDYDLVKEYKKELTSNIFDR